MLGRIKTTIVPNTRRSEITDAKEIVNFVKRNTTEIFGPNLKELGKLYELIEKSVLAITLEDQLSGKILAQACFFDYPNVYGVSAKAWESWLNQRYEASKMSSLNTLFLHFYASQNEYSDSCAEEILKSAFKAVPECHYIILCAPINSVPEASLSNVFSQLKKIQSKEENSHPNHNCNVFITNREKFIPVLYIRPANVKDNDDLIPLFNSCTDLLKATYGDFYVAEMIEAQNEHNKCLTSEAEGLGMGFMAITDEVNVELLNECFELRPFHGLYKSHPDDVLQPPESDDSIDLKTNTDVKHKLSNGGIIESEIETEFDTNQMQLEKEYSNIIRGKENKPFVPKFAGEPNAFAIQLFCIDEKYDSRSIDFLPKAFEAFPNKDFCIITLPPNVPEFALIQNFLRVTPKDTNKINQELYLFHRAGLFKSFEVREARSSDYEAVERLTHNMKSKDSILKDLNKYLKSRKDPNGVNIQAFVAQVLGRVVGIAILRQEEDIEYLRSNYNIEDFILYAHHKRDEHGHLNHFALIPIFSFLTKHFIKEILRKAEKTCLYYPIYPEYVSSDIAEKYSLITAMNFMVPVRKRNQIDYNLEKLNVNGPSDLVLKPKYNYFMPFALNHINRKLLLEPKISINLRIVVVGASELGISFLESLVFCPHLRFNNITLVSSHGLPGTLEPDSLRNNLFSHTTNYSQSDHAAISLRSWVNEIIGKLTHIDRRRKQITINGDRILPYDHLILCTGEQYYHVAPIAAQVYNMYSKQQVKPYLTRPLFDEPPANMFVINNEYEAENVLTFVEKNNIAKMREHVVFYGLDLNVLATIHSFLEMGVDPMRIVIFCGENLMSDLFNNPFVTNEITKMLKRLNIEIFESYQMHEWNNGRWGPGKLVNKIRFKHIDDSGNSDSTNNKKGPSSFELDCCLLLCYYKKDVDYTTFTAVNKSHLVYDGRLVIDNDFHTNDSCIRAAGTMTKFKRSYYVDTWSHACFNQKEIGMDLAYKVLQLVDPLLYTESDRNEKTDSARVASNQPDEKVLIELYKKPLVRFAILPGGLYYLNVTKPGLRIPYSEEQSEREELVTNTENGYFRIHLNKHKCVQTITCLSKKKFNVLNFTKLYGFHEQYLNRLLSKYTQKTVVDFYNYFDDNWATALFHDRFEDLCKEIREISINPNNGIKSVNDLLRESVDKDLILTKDQRDKISEHFTNSQTRSLVEKRLLNFLSYNGYHLPMYAKPDMV